jgi:hypothetical protein
MRGGASSGGTPSFAKGAASSTAVIFSLRALVAGLSSLGGLGRKLASGLRCAGLDHHRPALDGPGDVEGAADGVVLALVVEHVKLAGIEVDAGVHVADKGVVGPGIPKAGHHVVEFARTPVALVVFDMLGQPEIQRCVRIRRGDDVPAGAAVADVIERRESARDVVGQIERRGAGGHQPDALGDGGERRQQRERFERRRCVAALERVDRHVEHREVIGHEERIELAALQRPDKALHVGEIEIRVRKCARIAPGPGVNARWPHERAEPELT